MFEEGHYILKIYVDRLEVESADTVEDATALK
jgi:hypothetical protein